MVDIFNGFDAHTSTLSSDRCELVSITVGEFILFGGGLKWNDLVSDFDKVDVVDIYSIKTFSWTTTRMPGTSYKSKGASLGCKAIFPSGDVDAVYVFESSTFAWFVHSFSKPNEKVHFLVLTVNNFAIISGGFPLFPNIYIQFCPEGMRQSHIDFQIYL